MNLTDTYFTFGRRRPLRRPTISLDSLVSLRSSLRLLLGLGDLPEDEQLLHGSISRFSMPTNPRFYLWQLASRIGSGDI